MSVRNVVVGVDGSEVGWRALALAVRGALPAPLSPSRRRAPSLVGRCIPANRCRALALLAPAAKATTCSAGAGKDQPTGSHDPVLDRL